MKKQVIIFIVLLIYGCTSPEQDCGMNFFNEQLNEHPNIIDVVENHISKQDAITELDKVADGYYATINDNQLFFKNIVDVEKYLLTINSGGFNLEGFSDFYRDKSGMVSLEIENVDHSCFKYIFYPEDSLILRENARLFSEKWGVKPILRSENCRECFDAYPVGYSALKK